MIIRAERIEDYEAIGDVIRQAFGRDNEAVLVDALRDAPEFHPGLSLVAEEGSLIIGHILFSLITIESDGKAVPALALAPLAVRPERQFQGVGTMLIEQGIQICHKLGHRCIIVLGQPEYYSRFGFRPASKLGIFPPFSVPDENFMALGLRPGALNDIQGTVKYPEPFNEV